MLKLDKDNCITIENKIYLFTDEEKFPLRKIGSGTEASLYAFKKNLLIKLYKEELLYEKTQIYNEDRICEIAKKRDIIKKSELPFGPVYINGEFRGAAVYYHRLAPNFNYVNMILSDDYVINRFNEVLDSLKEFEDNGMYYIDLVPTNILLPKLKHSQIIDCDGKSIRLTEDRNGSYKEMMYHGFRDLMLEKIFDIEPETLEEYKDADSYSNAYSELIDDICDKYAISEEFRNEFNSASQDYEKLKDFLTYLKQDKVLSKKLVRQ